MTSKRITPEEIDNLLPQTQCGLCGYGGCMPYSEALVYENASINLCPPGGVATLLALGSLLQKDPAPYLAEMKANPKPPMLAVIREDECIGCVKCIQACPVDAILGSAKQMHTIIADECTGCELCVPACPVDCIDLIAVPAFDKEKRDLARTRFNQRELRVNLEKAAKLKRLSDVSLGKRKQYIEAAVLRAKGKKK
jgi:electron transport complex protein RnfB